MKIFKVNPEPIDDAIVAAERVSQKRVLIHSFVRSQSTTTELSNQGTKRKEGNKDPELIIYTNQNRYGEDVDSAL